MGGSPPTDSSVAAVMSEMLDVVPTLSGRNVPSTAYAASSHEGDSALRGLAEHALADVVAARRQLAELPYVVEPAHVRRPELRREPET